MYDEDAFLRCSKRVDGHDGISSEGVPIEDNDNKIEHVDTE